jgi:hypothetical protein
MNRQLLKHTQAMLRVNFPLVSNDCSGFPVSTENQLILPAWLPETICLESGVNVTLQTSTGPLSMV